MPRNLGIESGADPRNPLQVFTRDSGKEAVQNETSWKHVATWLYGYHTIGSRNAYSLALQQRDSDVMLREKKKEDGERDCYRGTKSGVNQRKAEKRVESVTVKPDELQVRIRI